MDGIATTLSGLLTGSSLPALFVIVLLKEAGLPVPIPADLLMISAGVEAANGKYSIPALALALELAVWIGCSLQFGLARGAGRQVVYRLGRFVGLTAERLDRMADRLERRGATAVFVGLNLPGVRAGIIIAAGLARLRYVAFAPAMLGGSTVYYGWHIALGYVVGPTAALLLSSASFPLVAVVALLALLGLVVWMLRRRGAAEPGGGSIAARVHAWTESACPACLLASAIEARNPDLGLAAESASGQ